MKKVSKIIILAASISVLCFICIICISEYQKYHIGPVAENIINQINSSDKSDIECIIDLKTVTDFEWDKVIVVSADFLAAGYSQEKIKRIWGIDYEFQSGFRSRLIFIKNDSIAYEESYYASVENTVKFNISISPSLDYYCILPYDNACITANRGKYKSDYCYSLIIM